MNQLILNVILLFSINNFTLELKVDSTVFNDNSTPNIIFIMSDDQGYADLGCYGSKVLKTPFIDKMAGEGMRFTQVYTGSPVCAPTRCGLLTGKHSGHITRRDNRSTDDITKPFAKRKLIPLDPDDFTFGEMLKKAGYATGAFGKWGVGNPGTTGTPDLHGFDEFYGYLDQVHAHDYYTDYLMHNLDTIPIPENKAGQKGLYSHDLIFEKSIDFVKKNKHKPFLLYLPLTLPHGKYEIPDNSLYADYPWKENVKNYAAMISKMDSDIGRLFSLLKELEIDQNTIVFFTSDNGPNPPFLKDLESNKPFRGVKRNLLEGGIRVPMIVRWPGKIKAGSVSEFTWGFWDVLSTFADLANTSSPPGLDGISVLPTLLGQNQKEKDFLYWEYYSPFQQAVRFDNWKGIRLGTSEKIHLFDLASDPQEKNNVASNHPQIVLKMKSIMEKEHQDSPHWPVIEKANKETVDLLFK
jgi:arylsulfatase A-like enzyme